MSANLNRSQLTRWAALSFIALLIFSIVLLKLPLVDLVSSAQRNSLIAAFIAHKRLVLVVVGAIMVLTGAWLLIQRKFTLILGAVTLGVFAICGFCAYKFQQHFPNADLFSMQRYHDNAAILLGEDILLSRYEPKPTLILDRKPISRAALPVIDVHFHLESLPDTITPERLVAAMDAAGVAKLVNLGGLPGMFEHFAKTFYAKYPDRFILFVKPDPNALMHKNGVAEQVDWIKQAVRMGARGIKENKSFGLGQMDSTGKLVPIDDTRLDPYWDLAGQLGIPVLVHTGEPPSFWEPVDSHNERYEELRENPQWSLHNAPVPSQQELMQQRERLLARHPDTHFIGAHFGMNPNNLAYAAYLLDKYPNYFVDLSSVIQELGREPYSARRFFIRYQDRILFGSDGGYKLEPSGDGWTPERMYRSYFEFLETDNEYMEYPLASITKQGNWRVHGLALPPDVLEKIYVKNAERLLPSSADIIAKLDASHH